ncbi:MAG: FAD-dependent oxidoreductase [Sphingomonadales bacterium]|nr:FAD-dependent oxidoreductase [Sphingomonadales bacterium]
MLDNRPSRWDREVDFIAIGSGIGGLSAAITAQEHGLSALVIERADQLGGVTALSMGEVWVAGNHHAAALGIEDSPESGFRYLQRLAMGYGSDAAILNFAVHAPQALAWFEERIGLAMTPIRACPDYYYTVSNDAVAEGRMLEVEPFPGASLGEWQARTRVSPQMPYGLTHADIFDAGGTANIAKWDFEKMAGRLTRDERCLGPGLAASFVKGALDRGIALMTGASAEELIADGERVAGVRVVTKEREIFVRARRGVLVAVSSYERNQDLNRTLSRQLELGSMVFATVNGAAFRLTGPLGARVASVPDITSLGFTIPGIEDEDGKPVWNSALPVIGQPHTIVVNRAGRRFGNEAFYRSFYYLIDQIDGGDQTHPNFPCWTIIDAQAREKYPFGSLMPEAEWPEGLGASAATLAELAAKIGVDAAGLEASVARFNTWCAAGRDEDFGRGNHPWSAWMCGDPHQRPNPNLGPLVKPPFYAVEMKRMGGTAIAASGILADEHGRALGWDDRPIEGLYVAGNSMARMETGAVMQSGISNARGMTYGWLIGRHAAGQPSAALAEAARRMGL